MDDRVFRQIVRSAMLGRGEEEEEDVYSYCTVVDSRQMYGVRGWLAVL